MHLVFHKIYWFLNSVALICAKHDLHKLVECIEKKQVIIAELWTTYYQLHAAQSRADLFHYEAMLDHVAYLR